ncbi:hypothetical protein SAMD00019534_054110, partial [Acytostelium subglobosum LB1]|uniref:hypothetical protein n=1 Tax=Acytostelium subglobosum LB1 TaxID=1410327 RepID=UPI000644E1D9
FTQLMFNKQLMTLQLLATNFVTDNKKMLTSVLMVFGPVIGYVSQYKSIAQTRNVEGFSNKVCLILLLSNILRCFFWVGKQFDSTLLYQSVVMIIAQLLMLHLCVSIRSSDSITRSRFLSAYSFFFLLLTYTFINTPWFFEALGSLSLAIEAMLGVPQLIQNYKKHSTKGLSAFLIGTWFVGDFAKTLYFYFSDAPSQFIYCGLFQLLVDVAITFQMMTY